MKFLLALLFVFVSAVPAVAQTDDTPAEPTPLPELPPFTEYFILDELRTLRQNMERFRVEMTREITAAELAAADRAISYNTNTVTFLVFLITGIGAIFALVGWKSISDMRQQMRHVAESQVAKLTKAYEDRLTALEDDLKQKSEAILENQVEIEKTQKVHSLWVQAGAETEPRKQIELYDQILGLSPDDSDVMAAKADAALRLDENDWALSICNRIIETDPEHAYARYQRACAYAQLGDKESALEDLAAAIELSDSLKESARTDEAFQPIARSSAFKKIVE